MERTIGDSIRVLSHMIRREMDSSPLERQLKGVTGTNTWLIGYIGMHKDSDVFQKDIEKQFGITRSTVSKIVNLMEQKGLIERQSVPGDTRLKKLVLTEWSWEIFAQMEVEFREMERTLADGFSPEELDQFFNYIDRMQNNIKKKEERRRK